MSRSPYRVKDMTQIALMVVLITVCSWISIPAPVPFTLQTFAVFFALLSLGGRHGMTAICVYLIMGAIGLPVFSGFQGGMGVLAGAYGGYIGGFLVMALLFRFLAEKASEKRSVAVLVLGLAACYAFGTLWFWVGYAQGQGMIAVLILCVFPFVLPDLGKLALAVFLARRLKRHIR